MVGLVTDSGQHRVTGVRIGQRDDGGTEQVVSADLIVDATGRGSRTPVWLEQLGYPRPSPGLVELVSARIGRLPDALNDVVEVLALGEPLGVALLVQRAQMGTPHARLLRGRIDPAPWPIPAAARAGDTLRGALLVLDSDLAPDPALFTDATLRATELGDLALAGRTSRQGRGGRRLDGLGERASERVRWIDARVDSFETGLHQAAIVGSSWVRGLLLAGLLDQAERAAWRYRERCQDTPGPGDVITGAMCGQVKSRGQIKTDQPATGDRHLGRRRAVQSPDRRSARRLGPHRRGPPLPRLLQALLRGD